jgi:hypothetical protein
VKSVQSVDDPAPRFALRAARLDRLVLCSENAYFHGRFALALLATTEYVAIFDDDSIPGCDWFANCLETMARTPGILGTNGEDIELAARAWRLAAIRSYCPPHPAGDPRRWGSTRGMELGVDDVASSVTRSNQLVEREQIVAAEIADGWRPLCMRGGK